MKTNNRNGVLGLETARAVFVFFLILAITGVAIILSLTALNDSIGSTIDSRLDSHSVTNESTGGINQTGYTLAVVNSTTSGYSLTAVWDTNATGDINSVPLVNVTVSNAGLVQNATVTTYGSNATVSYDYSNTFDTHKTDNIVGNVSGGIETFFGSTGTIFSILIVVVIILAISIIIWAVGRFGQRTDMETANL